MPTTGSGKFPYPNSSAVPDVPADVLLLAQRIDKMSSGWTVCADATARAALVTNGDAYEGLHVYQIDTKVEYIYLSSVWTPWNSDYITWSTAPSNVTVGTGGAAATVQKYKWSSGRLYFEVRYTLGTGGGFAMGTNPTINLPFNIAFLAGGNYRLVGEGTVYDASSGGTGANVAFAAPLIQTDSTVRINSVSSGVYGTITSTAPMTWTSGDALSAYFWADPA